MNGYAKCYSKVSSQISSDEVQEVQDQGRLGVQERQSIGVRGWKRLIKCRCAFSMALMCFLR
jgi:hypothetical protein